MAIGTKKVENYVPVVRLNQGIYTAYDITTLGDITAANVNTLTDNVELSGTLAVTGITTLTGGLVANGGITNATANHIVPFVVAAVQQDLAGAGAVTLTQFYTAWTTGGAVAGTLADAARIGQLKKIRSLTADEGTLTLNGTSTIVFTDAGDCALLIWNGTDWVVLELSNDADGATAPVYTP